MCPDDLGHDCGHCDEFMSTTIPALCPDDELDPCNGGLVVWQRDDADNCSWTPIVGPGGCIIGPLQCYNGYWYFHIGCMGLQECDCKYVRCAEGTGDCPDGEYRVSEVGETTCDVCTGGFTLTLNTGIGG